MTFNIDASELGGLTPDQVVVLRNDVPLAPCEAGTAAVPDPCLVTAYYQDADGGVGLPSGDVAVVVRTSHFSTWKLGAYDLHLSAPLPPVAAAPAVNKATAGSAIPVKFRVGGFQGMGIVQSVVTGSCGAGNPNSVPIVLTYDPKTQVYGFIWRTPRTKGCQELRVTLVDGNSLTALFQLK
jgi:hypothetical protein